MKKYILVIDDNADILDVVQMTLTLAGYRVQTSQTGACLSFLESDPPDLILLDVSLQGEDGRDLCRQVKGREQTQNIPVILFSAHNVPTQGAAEAGGADGFLAKPFRSKDLLALIASWVDAGPKA